MAGGGASPGVSHRTLLAVAAPDGGYDCHEWPSVPRASAPRLRRLDATPDRGVPDRRAAFEAVDPYRHDALVVVPRAGPVERYCCLPLDVGGFRDPPVDDPPDATGAVLVAVASDAAASTVRRYWDGARAVVAVLVEATDGRPPPMPPERLLVAAVERLTGDRAVVRQGPVRGVDG